MLKRTHLFAIGMMLLAASSAFAQKPALLKFSNLEKYDPANETFRIEGFVLDIYKCQPCPPGAMCKPCIPDNVTIVDSSDLTDISKLKRLRIYTDKTDRFEVKKEYLLTVKVKGNLASGRQITDVDLTSIENGATATPALAIGGKWTGESICTIKDSPCHDEHALYIMEEPDSDGKMKIEGYKVINGQPDFMGTLACTFDKATSTIKCLTGQNIWNFPVTGKTIEGTLTLADGRLYRRISVTKEK
jgi:hypothetical protein